MLGVFLDENLNFEYHIKQTRNKISKALFPISKAKHLLSSSALKSLHYPLVHPLFLYCLPIYSSTSIKSLNSLFLSQKNVSELSRNLNSTLILSHCFTLLRYYPFHDLILQQKLMLMHSIDKN